METRVDEVADGIYRLSTDECGSMNNWLAAAPRAKVAHGEIGCLVSLNDMADRPPRALADGEVLDLGGKCVRHIDTPHVPHNWEARVLYGRRRTRCSAATSVSTSGTGRP